MTLSLFPKMCCCEEWSCEKCEGRPPNIVRGSKGFIGSRSFLLGPGWFGDERAIDFLSLPFEVVKAFVGYCHVWGFLVCASDCGGGAD